MFAISSILEVSKRIPYVSVSVRTEMGDTIHDHIYKMHPSFIKKFFWGRKITYISSSANLMNFYGGFVAAFCH